MTPRTARHRAAGTSLLEMMFVCAILAPILLVITASTGVVSRTLTVEQSEGIAAGKAREICRRLAGIVESASLTSLRALQSGTWIAPVTGIAYQTIRFQQVDHLANGGAMVLDRTRTLIFARERGEPANGRDDDGDGLVDEGNIELINTDGSRSTLASGVESIAWTVSGRVLTVTLQVGVRDATHRMHRARQGISISLRNN